MLRDRVASIVKWPIFAFLFALTLAASSALLVGLVYLGILTARWAGW